MSLLLNAFLEALCLSEVHKALLLELWRVGPDNEVRWS